MRERRQFSRIVYHAIATLEQGSKQCFGQVKDISLHGLLLSVDDPNVQFSDEHLIDVFFTLPGSEIELTMSTQIVDQSGAMLRMRIDHIDIESLSHLKRLVQLNVGNDELLNRNIEHLSDIGDEEHS
ncbi:PilZ domain-containing protein [Vibrio xiamenensis]|uniref:Cyclic diguanosine monophosphate-binding protein n=1 Tax=Vibrio xiamenensis TaxID=861298 RepID=A0A1G8B2Y1_9VIBR|nr:PilZ domain-containing protein [Vibrio xiamenensis]SDH27547.1 PilZ domain-containing protein [Vibrio xiamenensis]